MKIIHMARRLVPPHAVFVAAAAALALCLLPAVAQACPVCGQAKEESQLAFIVTTTFMTLLPLTVVGSLAYYLWRRIKRLEAREARSAAPQPDPAE
jgi:heme/copper-type cytochrome/quinol oxidase subunit 2